MEYIMGFGSPHRALKAEAILKASGVPFRLLPVPKALDSSCGLVISVAAGELDEARGALGRAGCQPRNTYRKEGDEYVKV